jgi:hypothetical protein
LTLIEVLVSVTLAAILAGVVIVSGKAVRDSQKRATAERQMAIIAQAIERYAEYWPRWEITDYTQNVVIADKGWPDFIPGRLFAFGSGPFPEISGFNDNVEFRVDDIVYSKAQDSFHSAYDGSFSEGDVLDANACLAYALTASSGKGPYLTYKDGSGLLDITKVHKLAPVPLLPSYAREVFVDPWGTPYRYFWVYRDPEPDPASTDQTYYGYYPVDYGAFVASPGDMGDINDPGFLDGFGNRKKAVGWVLESAGADREFGNVWDAKAALSNAMDVNPADDNLMIRP